MRSPDRPPGHNRTRLGAAIVGCGLLLLLFFSNSAPASGPALSVSSSQVEGRDGRTPVARGSGEARAPRRPSVPADDWTYRPTVLVRRGTLQGSGTIIASVEGETLVLTAAHVLNTEGPVVIELHRYNLGMERKPPTEGVWPRHIKGTVAATDTAADLAIVRIDKMRALPYVARLTHGEEETAPDSIVTSVGIDNGSKLTSWQTKLLESASFEINDSRDPRRVLITEKIPEHGRSGGGLFLANGELVGVCIGHAELVKGRRSGVFASRESLRLLLDAHNLSTSITRSEMRMARMRKGRSAGTIASSPARSPAVVKSARSLGGDTLSPSSP
jgi:S1-C subfamily serine protease